MKKSLLVVIHFVISLALFAENSGSGLYFKSYSSPGRERTSLTLENDMPLNLSDETTLSFDMFIRKEVVFGSVVRIISNTNESIALNFSADEKDNRYPNFIINDRLNPVADKIKYNEWFPVSITLATEKDSVYLRYKNIQRSYPLDMSGWEDVKIVFGVCSIEGFSFLEIPPMNLKDVKIAHNGKLARHWALDRHDGNKCYDLIDNVPAITKNPQWIIDSHTVWKAIYSKEFRTSNNPQYAYDTKRDVLLIVPDEKSIICFRPTTGQDSVINVKAGYPAGKTTNQLIYNPVKDELISYNLDENTISTFSFSTASWSKRTPCNTSETNYWHHTASFYEGDTSIVAFGGYGFYVYKNTLHKVKPRTNKWETVPLVSIAPRYSPASAIVGDKMYIFGGKGSEAGKQELNSHSYLDLYSVNLKTNETTQIWQINAKKFSLPCGNMIFNPADSCFYVLDVAGGGILQKVSITKPEITEITGNTGQSSEADYPFYTLFYSPNQGKLFALLCRNFNAGNSIINLFEISYPPISQADSKQVLPTEDKISSAFILTMAGIIILLGCIALYLIKNRKKKQEETPLSVVAPNPSIEEGPINVVQNFDRTRQCVSLLGGFNVMDKNGENITPNFTPILKSLLLLILLNSDHEEKGVNSKKIDSLLWFDKDEKAARNNRNVSLNRLKILLENIGEIKLINNGGFWKIAFGDDVFCDYYAAMEHIRSIKTNSTHPNLIPELLELLMFGPMLPYTHADWLDKFKSNYSNNAIDILGSLAMKKEYAKNDDLRIQIADSIFLFDSLNEEALGIKCNILYNAGKKGLAKSAYDNFTKEYHSLLGENYKYSLTQVIDFATRGWPEV
jgi:DNA-binding SARP family transcriptional activator